MNSLNFNENKENLNFFDILVVAPELNRKKSFIKKLSLADKKRIEILVNEECPEYCKHRSEHFRLLSEVQLSFYNDLSKDTFDKCSRLKYPKVLVKRPMYLTQEEIHSLSMDGFRHFKIQGRTIPACDYFGYLAEYLIKKEYHAELLKDFIMSNLI
jgi:hypothetical protein